VTTHGEEPEASEEAPVAESKLTIVVILAMLVGVLLTVGAVGAYLHFQQRQALQGEVLALRAELIQKNLALDEMKGQIEVLSKQMHALKEYSIARSSAAGEKDKKVEAAQADGAANAPKSIDAAEKRGAPQAPSLPKLTRPNVQNCELAGKSPEEQAATLQRCVNLIDPPKERLRSP
jgi:uncharacterized protein HemX